MIMDAMNCFLTREHIILIYSNRIQYFGKQTKGMAEDELESDVADFS